MRTGGARVSCHAHEREGPNYIIAGSDHATGGEPNDHTGVSVATRSLRSSRLPPREMDLRHHRHRR